MNNDRKNHPIIVESDSENEDSPVEDKIED